MSKFHTNSETNKQIKDNEILFIGCSHTAGIGHGVSNTVYTHVFSKLLGLTPLVDAHPGKSNYLTEEKLNTYDLRNKKVIIQFIKLLRPIIS